MSQGKRKANNISSESVPFFVIQSEYETKRTRQTSKQIPNMLMVF